MSTDARDKDRIRFQEVAKLATPSKSGSASSEKENENSGMIDLTALAAGPPSSDARAGDKEIALAAIPMPVPTAPMLFRIEDGPPTPSSIPIAAPVSISAPLGAAPPRSSGGGGQTMRNEIPGPSSALRLPAGTVPVPPRLPHPTMRVPAMPSSTLVSSSPSLAPQTTRPTVMAAYPEKRGGSSPVWVALATGMGLGALAAAAFFQMRTPVSGQSSQVGTAPGANAAHGPSAQSSSPENPGAAPVEGGGVDPSAGPAGQLPDKAVPNEATPDPRGAPAPSAFAVARPPTPGAATSQWHVAEGATKPMPSTQPLATKAREESLDALMKRAVGITATPAFAPAPPAVAEATAPVPGNVPMKPAMGAVQGAVGTLLPAARYCLGPDDPISHATVTFQSDGSVQTVAIAGAAAGQPAEGCIRSRLMAARVPPFSNPTFTWTVTIRPAS